MIIATPTAMLGLRAKSSQISGAPKKLHVEFCAGSSICGYMENDGETGPAKVRSGLFALITSRLEDAHQIAVNGQATDVGSDDVRDLVNNLRSMLDEIKIQIDAIELMRDT